VKYIIHAYFGQMVKSISSVIKCRRKTLIEKSLKQRQDWYP